jgi:hypothetical protein
MVELYIHSAMRTHVMLHRGNFTFSFGHNSVTFITSAQSVGGLEYGPNNRCSIPDRRREFVFSVLLAKEFWNNGTEALICLIHSISEVNT